MTLKKNIFLVDQPFIKHYFTIKYKLKVLNHLLVTDGKIQNRQSNGIKMADMWTSRLKKYTYIFHVYHPFIVHYFTISDDFEELKA